VVAIEDSAMGMFRSHFHLKVWKMLMYSLRSQQKHNHVHCTIEQINELEHPVVLLDPIYILKRRLWEWNGRDGMGRNGNEYEHEKS
jgi:hypothetical protein